MVPNLVAEFEARSSAHSAMLGLPVNMGLSVSRPSTASGSRQVPKDLQSQEFPTVVPVALPSNSSSKSYGIPLPPSANVSAISLERPSTAMSQKEKVHKDLPPTTSAPSQQLRSDLLKIVQPARVEPAALHVPTPFYKDGTNYNGKYEPYVPNAMQAPHVPHSEKRPEEPAHVNTEWSAQAFSRPEATVTHGARTSANRTLLPVELVPSSSLQRELPSDQPHPVPPSSRDELSGGPILEAAFDTRHGVKYWQIQQKDTPSATGRLTPQAGIPKHATIDGRISPFPVQEHKASHSTPSALQG